MTVFSREEVGKSESRRSVMNRLEKVRERESEGERVNQERSLPVLRL